MLCLKWYTIGIRFRDYPKGVGFMNKLEMGGNQEKLDYLAKIAKTWFEENSVEVPKGATEWQKRSVRKKELPPNMSYVTLVSKEKVRINSLIAKINNQTDYKEVERFPITFDNIEEVLGFYWIDSSWINKHKYVLIRCLWCGREENISYGTLQRMRKANHKFCRYCRNAGGKRKDLSEYIIDGFTPVSIDKSIVIYRCDTCKNIIKRGMGHSKQSEYLVCEYCHPNVNTGTKIKTGLRYFDSYLEYQAFKILLNYFSKEDILRQVPYHTLFLTNTKHTADFYIKPLDIVLEITSIKNGFSHYNKTREWKEAVSTKVVFATSLSMVEDIVRSRMKVRE